MPVCVINQPAGLGDILWIQPIVDHMIDCGYEVVYPVIDLYYEMVSRCIRKDGLRWVQETGEYPMKDCFSSISPTKRGEDLYLPTKYADRHLPSCPVMISKYYMVNIPVTNWHSHINIERNADREQMVFDMCGINKDDDYTLVNTTYGTPPTHITRSVDIQTKYPVVKMSYDECLENEICLFDWIGVIEHAKEIHTTETAMCYLVDLFAQTPHIFMYEKRQEEQTPTFYQMTALVYRNPNWTYCK